MPLGNSSNLSAPSLIGQLIMPRLDAQAFSEDKEYAERIELLVREARAGGFCVFGGTPEMVARATKKLQAIAIASEMPPLLFSCDCEFGLPMRLTGGGTEFPDAMAIAKTGEPKLARDVGSAIAREMRSIGLGWNFAPVADVNSNPANPIINTRAFGGDPKTVAIFAAEFMRGLQSEGVAAAGKHFPGHGDTAVDSLRERLGFDGVIVTDALEMHAITEHFGPEEAAIRAFRAGADILLLPLDALRAGSAIESS